MANPSLGQSWRNLVATDLDAAVRLLCQAENSRKRPRKSTDFKGYNVLNHIPDWYSHPRGLSQFLINNPPDSDSDEEEDNTGLPRFGLLKHLKKTVVEPPNAILDALAREARVPDYRFSPGSPRKSDFCVDRYERRMSLNAQDQLPSDSPSSGSASFTKNKMPSNFSDLGSWMKSTSNKAMRKN